MDSFKTLHSTCIPLPIENVDTDQIIPARFLKATTREGFGDNLFRDWRFNKNNEPTESFILNNGNYAGEVLVAGRNFGCGSSREHAAWAIYDFGFKVVISSFFADIFRNNALNNGLLPIQVSDDILDFILKSVHDDPKQVIKVDLENQEISLQGKLMTEEFEISPYKKHCLMKGFDDIDFLLSKRDNIGAYEENSAYKNI